MVAEPVDVRTARAMAEAGDVIVDVRRPEEYASGHVAGAVNIPIDELVGAHLPPGQLITTCSMGGRAGRAADLLDTLGRTAFAMAGGTKAWEAAGYPTVRGSQP